MMTKNIKSPDINLYSDFRLFLNDFIKLNKAQNKNFSFRFFAKKLGWSASYLNDLIQGRRSISLQKALELSNFLGLKGIRAERLLLLTLSETAEVAKTFSEILTVRDSRRIVHTMLEDDPKLLGSVLIFRVIEYLIWTRGAWDPSDFISRTKGQNGETVASTELQSIIKLLEERKVIQWNPSQNRYLMLREELYEDWQRIPDKNDIVNLEKDYVKHYLDFLNNIPLQNATYGNWAYYSGTIQIPYERISEIDERVRSLRNYLSEIDRQTRASYKENPGVKSNVYEYSLHLFPVFMADELLEKQKRALAAETGVS
jgi:uncharacterized protein (TIGR02147 family)